MIAQLEAAIVDGACVRYGAVAGVTRAKNPVKVAPAVMESGPRSFIFGPAADDFARTVGLCMAENSDFTTASRKSHWEALKGKKSAIRTRAQGSGTVGAVALDVYGRMAAAGSTGGMVCKARGRLGDAAIMGAGIFANDRVAVIW
jgi:L-asparaginase / beta-aspartyl-peptidase